MNLLNAQELNTLRYIIENGHKRAAQAFSSLVEQHVCFEIPHFKCLEAGTHEFLDKLDDNLTLVVTDIIGEVGGSSYLLLSEQENIELQKACFPDDSKLAQSKVMGEALIKEIDNVISAAVITEFSNTLGLQIFGSVPQLHTVSDASIKEKIKQDLRTNDNYYLLANTRFRFANNDQLQPQFFWRLTSDFIQCVRNHAATLLTNDH